jgi:hypothetical protein
VPSFRSANLAPSVTSFCSAVPDFHGTKEPTMPKSSQSARAAASLESNPVNSSGRLDAIGRYLDLRDWSFAVIDLMEVAGKSTTRRDPVAMCDQTLTGLSGLLRHLLQQIDERVDVIREVGPRES